MLDATKGLFDAEVKRKRDLLLLKNAADFPRVLRAWGKTTAKFRQGTFVDSKDPRRQRLFQNPATAHYQDHYFDPWTHLLGDDYTVELARFSVPEGAIGIVRKLFQWVEGYCNSDNWGDPITGVPAIDGIVWSLRLSDFAGQEHERYIDTQIPIPGRAYSDLPTIRYLWHLPHAPASDLNLVIPGGNTLRFFARCPDPGQSDYKIMGRLVGYWQSSEYTVEAGINVKKGF